MKVYKVYRNGEFIAETTAVSPEQAINNVQYSCGYMYNRSGQWVAKTAPKTLKEIMKELDNGYRRT